MSLKNVDALVLTVRAALIVGVDVRDPFSKEEQQKLGENIDALMPLFTAECDKIIQTIIFSSSNITQDRVEKVALYNADPNTVSDKALSPLEIVLRNNFHIPIENTVKVLLDHGAETGQKSRRGSTILEDNLLRRHVVLFEDKALSREKRKLLLQASDTHVIKNACKYLLHYAENALFAERSSHGIDELYCHAMVDECEEELTARELLSARNKPARKGLPDNLADEVSVVATTWDDEDKLS